MAREAIFIGYRREDTADVAGRIYDALSARFGKGRIFKDVDNLRPGADFGDHIRAMLPRCRVGLILIGPNWIETADEQGYRRLDDPNDWVRIEIELALDTPGLDVVPVLVNGARMPRADELPRSLHPLLRRHAAIIRRDPDFHDDVGRLATALRASVKSGVLDLASLGGERKAAAAGAGGGAPPIAAWLAGVAALALVGVLLWAPRDPGPPAPSSATGVEAATTDGGEGAGAPYSRMPDPTRQPEGQQVVGASRETRTATPQQPSGAGDCPECPEMVAIPAGSFTMGAADDELDLDGNEGPRRMVSVRAFAASKYEITFAQWDACVAGGGCGGYRPADQGWGRGNRPVINVSWNDTQSYIAWLNDRADDGRYRLLSEAEWEYAARAGTTSAYSTGSSLSTSQARFNSSSTAEVGSYPANRFGLHDMHGNVLEWTQDCWTADYSSARGDGSANTTGDCAFRIVRGGSWSSTLSWSTISSRLRSATRGRLTPTHQSNEVGFRVARTR